MGIPLKDCILFALTPHSPAQLYPLHSEIPNPWDSVGMTALSCRWFCKVTKGEKWNSFRE